MNVRDIVVKRAREKDTRKISTISIRVEEKTKNLWKMFCKTNRISQQASFEAILHFIMEEQDGN